MKVNGVEVDVHDYDTSSVLTHMKTNKRISSYESRMKAHEAEKEGKKPVNIGKIIFYIIVSISFGPYLLVFVGGLLITFLNAIFGM